MKDEENKELRKMVDANIEKGNRLKELAKRIIREQAEEKCQEIDEKYRGKHLH